MRKSGFVTFARFMELALYCPLYGYYEKEKDTTGRRGDFFTSVSVGSLFGELLAAQFAAWLDEAPAGTSPAEKDGRRDVWIIEAGAHDGKLAADILHWLREKRPALYRRLKYGVVEPSSRRQGWQRQTLAEFPDKVFWARDWANCRDLSGRTGISGVIFCNELLDAMPVRRLGWNVGDQRWFEWGVALQEERFVWVKVPNPPDEIPKPVIDPVLLKVLPDGFTIEICPAAETWWREAARVLDRGRLLAIDYGLTDGEYFAPERKDGTLRAYHRHRLSPDLLARPGEQDLTAHVNFSAIQAAGETEGMCTEAFLRQEKFLVQIAEQVWKQAAVSTAWDADRLRQFQTLIHPQHLGRNFRVLIQSRR
jgi:SAM-dependent MidA family methyltransferase